MILLDHDTKLPQKLRAQSNGKIENMKLEALDG